MPTEINDNNTPQEGNGNKIEIRAENQQADKIINVGFMSGGITITNEKKDITPTNKFLCRKLIEAIQDYNPRAKNFLEQTIDESDKANWENGGEYLKRAKNIIQSSFVSVLGEFLRQLFTKDLNQKQYFELSIRTTKRTLQLLCFAFISSFWDQSKGKSYPLTEDQLKQLRKIFYTGIEPNITFYANLFKTLITIFREQQIDYPFVEIKTMEDDFKEEGFFFKSAKTLDAFRVKFEDDQSIPAIDEIDNALASFWVSLKFLVNYKMVSVKVIGYEELRYNAGQYLLAYSFLGSNNPKYNYRDKPINSNAVLLFRDNYQEGLNLFPFVIDINALEIQPDVRICFEVKTCFYACSDENDKTLTYFDSDKISSESDDDTDLVIEFNKDLEEIEKDIIEINRSIDKDITDLQVKVDKYKTMKRYEVYKTFQRAKESLFGIHTALSVPQS